MIYIIGGGIAGYTLADRLLTRAVPFCIFDSMESSASHISSGIINPLTGRRFALAWRYDELEKSALELYGEHMQKILLRRWHTPYKEGQSAIQDLEGKEAYGALLEENWVHIHRAYQVNVREYIAAVRGRLTNNQLRFERFDHTNLKKEEGWIYGDQHVETIIFAEGAAVLQNPFFCTLPITPNRGQALIISADIEKKDQIIQRGKFLCPWSDQWWVGSSFEPIHSDEPAISAKFVTEIEERIPDLIGDTSYRILDHLGAFRATVPDRRPLIGEHPEQNGLYVFNGFGTKGVSLVPWLSDQLIRHIFDQQAIDSEVDLQRYLHKII